MKKLFMILIACMALAACGGGNRSDANRDETDTTSTDTPVDTTKSGGTTGSASVRGVDEIEDGSADASEATAARP